MGNYCFQPLTISPSSTRLTAYGAKDTLTARFNGTAISADYVSWTCSNGNTAGNSYINLSNNRNGTATVTALANTGASGTTVTATYEYNGVKYSASATVIVNFSAYNAATATVYTSSSSYNLDDPDDEGGKSIIDQLESYFNSNSSRYYGLDSVVFNSVSDTYGKLSASTSRTYYVEGRSTSSSYDLASVYFTPAPDRYGYLQPDRVCLL